MKKPIAVLLLVLISSSAFAKSSRKIVSEDLSATKRVDATVVAAPAGTLPATGSVAYTPAAPALVAFATPAIGFPAPPANASPEMLQQAIQSFMNYMTGVDQNGNPQNFPDWVNPATVARQSSAPALPTITGQALDPSCDGLPEDAKNRMREYLKGCSSALQMQTDKVAINDFSTNSPVMYILNVKDLSCSGSTRVTFGVGSHNRYGAPLAGNGGGSSQTPAGFLVTKPHQGRLYQEWNSVGIEGMGSENSATAGRGVIIHPSNGHTLGCIGVPPSRFVTVKRAIAYGSVVLNYFPGQVGSSQSRCPAYAGSQNNKASRSATGLQ